MNVDFQMCTEFSWLFSSFSNSHNLGLKHTSFLFLLLVLIPHLHFPLFSLKLWSQYQLEFKLFHISSKSNCQVVFRKVSEVEKTTIIFPKVDLVNRMPRGSFGPALS